MSDIGIDAYSARGNKNVAISESVFSIQDSSVTPRFTPSMFKTWIDHIWSHAAYWPNHSLTKFLWYPWIWKRFSTFRIHELGTSDHSANFSTDLVFARLSLLPGAFKKVVGNRFRICCHLFFFTVDNFHFMLRDHQRTIDFIASFAELSDTIFVNWPNQMHPWP